ncbi:MAG TPA: hypothetical protein VH082_12210 [Rudaea sp.]|jgi:hypothetical protein|nr:hypothetical protein [Rudaea sp.]
MANRFWFGTFAALVSTAALAQSTVPHPRLILDTATLDRLHAKITANSAQWQKLKHYCDSFISGTVDYPAVGGDQNVGSNDYPDALDIGQGYEGDGYWAPLMSEGLCYRALSASDPTTAAKYGQKAADIAVTLSTPTSDTMRSEDPCTDDGYVIRFYGVGMGILYDWAYDKLTPTQRTQIYTTANQWLGIWDSNGACPKIPDGDPAFAYGNPLGNYFAGYFHAKTVVALATAGDNPSAPAQWTNWQNVQYNTAPSNPPHIGVQPYFAANMRGGGWPEGFGNYGPLATLNMSLPAWEVKTATGTDLINAAAPYTFPIDAADYLMYFTWPNRAYIDDRDTNHSNGDSDAPPPSSTNVGMFMQVLGVLRYWNAAHANVFQEYVNEVLAARGDDDVDAWEEFLFYDPNGTTAPLATLPLSYFAPGPNAIAARSDWTTSATWMSFRAGPYIEGGGGEEGFDQGSLALVRGGVPLLVNGTGWAVHEPGGDDDETRVYNDEYGNFNANDIYFGNRTIYNIFYVRHMSGAKLLDRYGQAGFDSTDAHTKVATYEDGSNYVLTLATNLEDMYVKDSANHAQVAAWSREVMYLRPNRFLAYDRTTAGNATGGNTADDQFLAFHFPANPSVGSAPSGEKRLDVTYDATYAGAMTTILPANATTTTIGMYPPNGSDAGSAPVKVWQVQVRAPNATASQHWLTAFDLDATSGTVATASAINVTSGNAIGGLFASGGSQQAVLFNSGAAGTTIAGSISYIVPKAQTAHTIAELPANAGYAVSVTINGSNQTITVTPGGSLTSSPKGVLSFTVSANGVIRPSDRIFADGFGN